MRRAERRERLAGRYGWLGPGIGGFVLILLGAIFLAQNYGLPVPEKWWTIFLIVPGLGALLAGWNAYRRDNRMSGEVTASLIGGAALLLISASFIFDWSWGALWPLALIAIGLGVVLRSYWR